MKTKLILLADILWTLFLSVYAQDSNYNETEGSITIGVISNGSYGIKEDTFQKYSYNVTLVKHTIQTNEVYQIFRSVRELDEDASVDVIMLFDYDPSILYMQDVIRSKNKKLIKWGERTKDDTKSSKRKKRHLPDHDICGDEFQPAQSVDIDCLTELNITPSDSMIVTLLGPQVLSRLVQELGWKLVVIFYESSTEKETAELVDMLSTKGVMFSMFNVDHVTDLHEVLAKIYFSMVRKTQDINIVVVCDFYCARKVFRTANRFDEGKYQNKTGTLLKMFSRWLVVVYGQTRGVPNALKACASQLDNVAIIAIPEISGASPKDSCEILDEILENIKKEDMLENITGFKQKVINKLQQEAAHWTPSGSPKCLGYHIETLLWTKSEESRIRQFSSVGFVDINGNVVLNSDIFPNTKYGYNGFEFHVSTLPYSPFVKKGEVNGTVVYGGMCLDLLKELAHKLNFTYRLSEPEDQMWGSYKKVKNKTIHNGLIGQLQREEVDMVVAPISIQSQRDEVMDFTYPFYYEYTTIIMKKPNVNATKWRTLVDPFKWEVLVSIGIAFVCVTIMGFVMEKYNPFYHDSAHARDRLLNGGLHTWHSSFWYMYGALLCQGGVHLPDSMSGRTLVSFWWLFCIIIVGTYSGNLIAFLTVSKERPPFEDMKEMVEQKGEYKWGTLGGTAWVDIFASSKRSEYKAINEGMQEFKKKDPDILHTSVGVHLQKVKQGDYAWIGDKTTIEIEIGKECDLMKTKDEFMPLKYAIGFPNNSPHVQTFSEELMTLHEMGLFQIWKRKNWPKASFCAGQMTAEAKPITLIDVQSAFYVCVVGIFLGGVAFMSEIILSRFRNCDPRRHISDVTGAVTISNKLNGTHIKSTKEASESDKGVPIQTRF